MLVVLGALCLTATLPIVRILIQGESLHESVVAQITATEDDIATRDARIRSIDDDDFARLARAQRRQQYATDRFFRLTILRDYVLPWIPQENMNGLVLIGGLVSAGVFLCIFLAFLQDVLVVSAVGRASDRMRRDCFQNILSCDTGMLAGRGQDGLEQQTVDDIETASRGLRIVLLYLTRGTLAAGACGILAVIINWRLTLLSLILVPSILLGARRLNRFLSRRGPRPDVGLAGLRSRLIITLSAIRTIIAFGSGQRHADHFERASHERFRQSVAFLQREALAKSVFRIAAVAAVLTLVFPGAWLILRETDTLWGIKLASGEIDSADLMTLYVLQGAVALLLNSVITTLGRVQNTVPAMQRVIGVLDEVQHIAEPAVAGFARSLTSNIHFRNVSLARLGQPGSPGTPLLELHNLSLAVSDGEVVGILSENDRDRNAMVSVLWRFADPDEGAITLDGFDIRDLRLADLRAQVGLVTAEFHQDEPTVAECIRSGREWLDDDVIEEAALLAGIRAGSVAFPGEVQTCVGHDELARLSQSDHLRIAIARAMVTDPRILILDLGATLVDPAVDETLASLIPALTGGRTVLVSSRYISESLQRFLTTVVIFKDGSLVAKGPYTKLISDGVDCTPFCVNGRLTRAA